MSWANFDSGKVRTVRGAKMMSVRVLFMIVVLPSQLVMPGYQQIRSQTAEVNFNETGRGRAFPDYSSNSAMCSQRNGDSYFGNELNFLAVPEMIVTGAADQLFLLNRELECQHSFLWNTTNNNFVGCTQAGIEESACRNHIRVYKRLPSQQSVLLVCGTQGGTSPQCRTLNVSGNILSPTVPASPSVPASDSLISSYPEFNWFGEFIDSTDKFFSSGYYRGNRQLGRDLNITFHSVSYVPTNGSLTLSNDFGTRDDIYWLNLPVTLVDYYRADYPPPAFSPNNNFLYQFYFVFLREVLVGINGLEIIYSRVARICRNDPGINGHFSTYMKARIFCEREVPPGRQFNGAVDYHYNEIQSLVFNDEGRFGEGGMWIKMMYGAFSGPTIGPPGTAICAYRADDSMTTGGTGFNRGIFDIFREDLTVVMSNGMTAERENTFVECFAGGRSTDFNNVLSVQDVGQIGEDPLVVFDGLIVTKMALDQVCVVTSSNPRQCQNQDVLFLGTDTGKILKVVFSKSNSQPPTFDPVVAEEITLNPGSDDAVKELRIVNDTAVNERYIYAATESRVYRLPLQRCSRLQGCNECIKSRDPYCVWNNNTNQVGCQATPLMASGSSTAVVSPDLWQSIHTGSVPECLAAPVCEVTVRAISADTITCEAECSNTMSITFSSNIPGANNLHTCGGQSTSPTLNANTGCVQFSGSIGLHSYICTVEARPATGSSVNFTNTTVTPPGPPICISERDVIHFIGQRNVTVCVNLGVLTDRFENYELEVNLNGTRRQNFTDDNCLKIGSLIPGSQVTYMVVVFNSIPSSCTPVSVNNINLLEDKPGPVENLQLIPMNVSVAISWSPPITTYGMIRGYTISLSGTVVVNCAVLNHSYTSYTIDGLIPYTDYTVDVKACTTAGEGTSNFMTFQTLCGTPSEVENLDVIPSQSFHVLNVTWDQPTQLNGNPNSIEYIVSYICYLPSVPITMANRTTQSLTFTINDEENLRPLTSCRIDVYAQNTCNSVTYSGPVVNVHGRTSDAIPTPVQNLSTIAVSDHSLFVMWEPPANYTRPGLGYSVDVAGRSSSVLDQTYFFVNTNLLPNTSYAVSVKAVSNVGMSAENIAMNTTKQSLPSPPSSVRFLTEVKGLILEWNAQSGIDRYVVFWKCNEMDGTIVTTNTSIVINNSVYLGNSYTWCTARVQSANEVGSSDLSAAVSIVIPQSAPPPPACFLADNRGSSAIFSFTVTAPFSLDELNVDYQLNTSSTIIETSNRLPFTNNSLTIPVERNTEYIFHLRLCNLQGCGDYCPSIRFTTNTNPPQAPINLNATNVTHSSASISWDPPANENPDNVVYTVEVTSSCQNMNGNILQMNLRENTLLLSDLCSGKRYSFVVQATAIANNVTGPLSRPYTFQTAEGTPSRPRDVQLDLTEKMFTVRWAEPIMTNGLLTRYEVLWYRTNINDCDNVYKSCNMNSKDCNLTDTSSDQHNATFSVDTTLFESILVCVRAYTNAGMGEWGSYYNGTIKTAALTVNDEQDCNGLIVVAVIASVAVFSSITMGIILTVVMCKTKEYSNSNGTKSFEEKPLPPNYDRTASMQSTKSLIGRDS